MTDFPRNNLWHTACSVMDDRTAGDTPRICMGGCFYSLYIYVTGCSY